MWQARETSPTLIYSLQLKGEIDFLRLEQLSSHITSLHTGGITLAFMVLRDQSELHGVLKKVRDFGFEILNLDQIGKVNYESA